MLVNMHEAKSRLSELVRQVANGEEIIIGRHGVPVARLVPYHRQSRPRRPGRLRERIVVASDFDATPEDVLAAFDGGR
ncbi:MAG: type II toxin-antitoxin system Phd/YefM family antitoxin [Euzebya sp.]